MSKYDAESYHMEGIIKQLEQIHIIRNTTISTDIKVKIYIYNFLFIYFFDNSPRFYLLDDG